jgi:hypothetical protein
MCDRTAGSACRKEYIFYRSVSHRQEQACVCASAVSRSCGCLLPEPLRVFRTSLGRKNPVVCRVRLLFSSSQQTPPAAYYCVLEQTQRGEKPLVEVVGIFSARKGLLTSCFSPGTRDPSLCLVRMVYHFDGWACVFITPCRAHFFLFLYQHLHLH